MHASETERRKSKTIFKILEKHTNFLKLGGTIMRISHMQVRAQNTVDNQSQVWSMTFMAGLGVREMK